MLTLVENFTGTYKDDPLRNLHFQDYKELAKDCELWLSTKPVPTLKKGETPRYYFASEEQLFRGHPHTDEIPGFDKIFTILPTKISGREGRKYVFWPTSPRCLSMTERTYEKTRPVVYYGHASEGFLGECHSVAAYYGGIGKGDYIEKLNTFQASQIAICHNSLHSDFGPQLKTRCFEAAFGKSLMLVKKDKYNLVEDWFTENEDFLYFEEGNLHSSIKHCLEHYNKYESMIESAYTKAMNNYTTKHFVERYLT